MDQRCQEFSLNNRMPTRISLTPIQAGNYNVHDAQLKVLDVLEDPNGTVLFDSIAIIRL